MLARFIAVISISGCVAIAQERASLTSSIDARADHYGAMSKQIWDWAEVGYKEAKSSALLRDELKRAGFRIEENIGGIPTAFTATYGSGKPVVAILGEFDALPGLSQDTVPQHKPLKAGEPGHGCGHNLFGVASTAAAISVKEWMNANRVTGTLRFYGTPAEEGGGGKVFMARAGAFKDVDVVLAWHPGDSNRVSMGSSLANISGKFRFYGKASHAAGAPEAGRSALDAVLVMAHAVELMREHIPSDTRVHYIITNGGAAPNVVPAFAEIYIYARHNSMPILDNVWARIVKCAEAGALATETRMEQEVTNSVWNVLPNRPLATVLDKNLKTVGGVPYTAEERSFAEELRKSFPERDKPVESAAEVQPFEAARGGSGGSTDVGDISWLVPTHQFTAATFVPGTPGHSWQSTACAGMSIGRKGMMVAAKTLALSAADLFTSPGTIAEAKADFEKARGTVQYRSRVPADQGAPLTYRDKSN
jgi:aminobenzoyl-glutamate utilization protein B